MSDGFGFFIEPALDALGVPDVPVVTASTTFPPAGPPRIDFPNGHPSCFVCGTCKRNRVFAHQAAGRAVVFIGDGESDRYAAGYSDVVFAKRSLVRLCLDYGWPFHRWTEFSEIDAWLAETIAAWQDDPQTLPSPAAPALLLRPGGLGRGPLGPAPARRPQCGLKDRPPTAH